MAWTANTGAMTGSQTASTLFAPTAGVNRAVGELLVFAFECSHATNTISSCVDNSVQAGTANSYTIIGPVGTGGTAQQMWYIWCVLTRSILAANQITITLSITAGRKVGYINTFTSSAGTITLDTSVQFNNPQSGGNIASAISSSGGSGVLIGCASGGYLATATTATDSSSGFGTITNGTSGATANVYSLAHNHNLNAGGSVTDTHAWGATFTESTSIIVAFKDAGSGAGATGRSRIIMPRLVGAGR